MAQTLQEQEEQVNKNLELLKQYKTQAQVIASKEIPQRRFGFGVTKEQQQAIVKRRTKAAEYLKTSETQKMQQEQALTSIAEQKKYRQQLAAYESELAAYNQARKLYYKGIPVRQTEGQTKYYLKRFYEESGYFEFADKRPTQIPQSEGGYFVDPKTGYGYASAFTPEGDYTQILSAEAIRQGYRVSFEETRPKPVPTSKEGGYFIDPRTGRGYTTAFAQPEKVKILSAEEIQAGYRIQADTRPQIEKITMPITPKQLRVNLQIRTILARDRTIAERIQREAIKATGLPPVAYPTGTAAKEFGVHYAVLASSVAATALSPQKQAQASIKTALALSSAALAGKRDPFYFGKKIFEYKATQIKTRGLPYALSYTAAEVLSPLAVQKTLRYATTPIKVWETPPVDVSKLAQSKGINIVLRQGEKSIEAATFAVAVEKPSRYGFYVSRYQKAFSDIFTPKLEGGVSRAALMGKYPTGKFYITEYPKASIALAEPFLIKKGQIIRALEAPRLPAVLSSTRTPMRQQPVKISTIQGGLRGEPVEFGKLDMTKLSEPNRRALQSILDDMPLKEKARIQMGDIKTFDFLKVTRKGDIRLPKVGRRTRRGELTAAQEDMAEIQYPREVGLISEERFREIIAIEDVTYPKAGLPKKFARIKGETIRLTFAIPEINTGAVTKIIGTGKKSKLQPITDTQLKGAVAKVAMDAAKDTPKIKIPTPQTDLATLPVAVGGTGARVVSQFKGTGQYERVSMETIQMPTQVTTRLLPDFNIIIPKMQPSLHTPTREMFKLALPQRSIPKMQPIVRSIPRETLRTPMRFKEVEITRPLVRQVTRQQTRIIPKQIVKTIPRTTLVATPFAALPKPASKPTPLLMPRINLGGGLPSVKTETGYRTFVIRGGKKVFLGGVRPKAQALQAGQQRALTELRATFGVERAKQRVRAIDGAFAPRRDIFRGYRIEKGKKIPLVDTYIQKRGKRLRTRGEISELRRARLR